MPATLALAAVPAASRALPFAAPKPASMAGVNPLGTLDELGRLMTVECDEFVFMEGDAAGAIYVVVSGTVRIQKLLADGRRQVIGFLEAGDLLGLAAGEAFAYSAEAVDTVRLRCVPRSQFEALIERRPVLHRHLLALAAGELQAAQDQMLLLGRKTARERICSFVLRRLCRTGGDAGTVEMPMSRTDIADHLGLTIETVSRTLSQLKAEGVIRMASLHSFEVPDRDRLAAMAQAM